MDLVDRVVQFHLDLVHPKTRKKEEKNLLASSSESLSHNQHDRRLRKATVVGDIIRVIS